MQYFNLFESSKRKEITLINHDKLNPHKTIKISSLNVLQTEPKSSRNFNILDKNETLSQFKNNCSFSCKNFKFINELTQKLCELMSDNEHLLKVNEYMMFHLEKKEQMYMKVSNEILKLKKKVNPTKSEKYIHRIQTQISCHTDPNNYLSPFQSNKLKQEFQISKTIPNPKENRRLESSIDYKPEILCDDEHQTKSNQITHQSGDKCLKLLNPNYMVPPSILQPPTSRNILKKPTTRNSHRNLPENVIGLITNKLNHYEKINEFTSRDIKRKYKENKRISLLKIEDESLHKMIRDNVQTQLYELTLSDDLFMEKMRGDPDEKLLLYSDSIGNLVIEYRNSLKLIKKIKSFLKGSVNLGNSLLVEDFAVSLIKNACDILNCDRTTLFVLDKVTDELIAHSGQGLKKSEVRVPKEKGIVGMCFKIGQKIKVDEAYSDIRFNQEVDKITGYKTKTILCMPLKDENGEIFGVIQSINKKEELFDEDDEELMEIFSSQASLILKNTMNYDENYLYACRLKIILDFNFDIEKISSIEEFTLNAEHFLMKLFNSNLAVFLVYDEEKECMLHFSKLRCEEKKNAGIIYYVLKSKEFYGCNPIGCKYYNNLADIATGLSLVTLPILDSLNKNVLAVVQMRYNYEFVGIPARPKAMALSIFDLYVKICRTWIERQ